MSALVWVQICCLSLRYVAAVAAGAAAAAAGYIYIHGRRRLLLHFPGLFPY